MNLNKLAKAASLAAMTMVLAIVTTPSQKAFAQTTPICNNQYSSFAVDLNGQWPANDGGTYYIHQG